jgi:hypothetical protein
MADSLYGWRMFRVLDVIDEGNRGALAIEIGTVASRIKTGTSSASIGATARTFSTPTPSHRWRK